MRTDKIIFPRNTTELRPQQTEFLEAADEIFKAGKKIIFAELPTGSGKSLAATALSQSLEYRSSYLTVTKQLQKQILEDYEYASALMGRVNYPTLDKPWEYAPEGKGLSCEDCDGNANKPCSWCSDMDDCPYKTAKREAMANPLAVLNFHVWLNLQNFGDKSFGKNHGRDMIVIDEGDMLESALSNFIGVEIPAYRLEDWGIKPPTPDDKDYWLPFLSAVLTCLSDDTKKMDQSNYMRYLKESRKNKLLYVKIQNMVPHLGKGGWVLTSDGRQGRPVVFRPVIVAPYAQDACWNHAEKFVLMSGHLGDPEVLAASLGVKPDEYWFVDWPSVFPIANRPCYLWPLPAINFRNEAELLPKVMDMIARTIQHYGDARGLVHTVSAKRANTLFEFLLPHFGSRLITYGNTGRSDGVNLARDAALELYKENPGSILLGQSVGRGIDLPGELCRFNLIPKVPWADISSPLVAGRLALPGGDNWYRDEALGSVVQMYGRAARNTKDYGDTHVYDGAVNRLVSTTHCPKYFEEALIHGAPAWAKGWL